MADCKRKTANLFDGTLLGGYYTSANYSTSGDEDVFKSIKVYLPAGTYTFSWGKNVNVVRMIIDGTYSQGGSTNISSYTFTSTTDDYVGISFRDTTSSSTIWDVTTPIMLNIGSAPLPYEPYGWLHSLRKLTTATDTITTLPADIYADGTNATVGLKGNMSQSGTPTPQNPITPSECGERTGNLFDATIEQGAITMSGDITADNRIRTQEYTDVDSGYVTISWVSSQSTEIYIMMYDANGDYVRGEGWMTQPATKWIMPEVKKIRLIWRYVSQADILPSAVNSVMVVSGQTPLPYEPHGYKLDIKSGNTTTPVYLGEVQSTRKIKKLVLDGTEDWKSPLSDNTRFYLDTITSDYLRANSLITYMCTHYIPYEQTTSASLVPNLFTSMSSGAAQRLYISDNNFTTVEDFKTYLAQQYANGTPVTVWYVLANETTTTLNEPLRKIGDYADSVSGISIPTITGKDSFDVLTTLKPSEVEVTYTGWHDASVKESDGSDWQ